jgi:mannose/fructose/N-acetylgalactosamine-specific phosphotransferase system component IID
MKANTKEVTTPEITYATYAERVAAIKGESVKAVEPETPKMGFIAATHLVATNVQATLAVHADMHPVMVEAAKQDVLDRLIKSGAI